VESLNFGGIVINGYGKHSELVIPGRSALQSCPSDWPEKLIPGSLNILVSKFPAEFSARKLPASAKTLDIAGFEPAFTIAQTLMRNNRLTPLPNMPNKGTAQVWRALLIIADSQTKCWVLRRFGSGLEDQIELVSDIRLRDTIGLTRDRQWPAIVTMFGNWRS